LFPEYNLNSNGDTYPSDINNYGGWVLWKRKQLTNQKRKILPSYSFI
jgi:hypothetical protein